jgi:uncharacterized protein YllA (UPF0747 family)
MPVVMARSAFTLLEPRAGKLLKRYGMSVAQSFVDEETLEGRIAHALAPDSILSSFADAAAGTQGGLQKVRADLSRFDPTLAAALDKSRAKILYQLEKTRRKIEHELLRRDQRASGDARYLANLLFPERHLQERFYSILPFIAEHGLDLIDQLYDTAQVECPDHRVLAI